jgi:hypothetical protein
MALSLAFCLPPVIILGAYFPNAALLVDRGLPSRAPALRVGWGEKDGAFVTDHFALGDPGELWVIDKVRTWAVPGLEPGNPDTLGDWFDRVTLYGGLESESPPATTVQAAAECACHGPVSLAGTELRRGSNRSQNPQVVLSPAPGTPYQKGGRSLNVWRVDFEKLNWNVPGGVNIQFGVFGAARPLSGPKGKHIWFNHASVTGGKHQFRLFEIGGSPVVSTNSGLPSDDSIGINVQVWGHLTAHINVQPLGRDWRVVLLGETKFDVLQVKSESLRFGPNGEVPADQKVEDSDHDGRADLVLKMSASGSGIPANQSIGCLTGLRVDNVPFEGCGFLPKR